MIIITGFCFDDMEIIKVRSGCRLDNDKSLAHYCIENDNLLRLVLKMKISVLNGLTKKEFELEVYTHDLISSVKAKIEAQEGKR